MNVDVVGAGPAGVSAAYHAAKAGHRVVLYDKEQSLARKPCGEGTLGSVAQFSPFTHFDSRDFVLARFRKALISRDGGTAFEMKIPVQCYILDKRRFLEEFVEEAAGYGVAVRKGTRVQPDSIGSHADVVVDATGFVRASLPARTANRRVVPILRAYARWNGAVNDDEILIDLADGGYFWIFPYGDRYNVGFGGEYSSMAVRHNLDAYLRRYNLELCSRVDGAAISAEGPSRKLVYGRVRLAGESAGMVNPGTGEGIRFALHAGSIVLEDDYEERAWREFGADLHRSVKIGKMVFSLSVDELSDLLRRSSPELVVALFDGKVPRFRDVLSLLRHHPGIARRML